MSTFQPHQPLHFTAGLTLLQRVAAWLGWVAASGLLLWRQRAQAPGTPRLAAAAPLLAANLIVPLLFGGDEVVTCFIVAIFTSMIANLKVLGWVLNRGCLRRPLTPAQFLAVYALPIIPAEAPEPIPPAESSTSTSATEQAAEREAAASQAKARRKGRTHETYSAGIHFWRFVRKLVLLAGVVWVLATYRLPPIPQLLVQTLSMYLVLSISCDGLAALVSTALRLPISPHFDSPYGCTSVADFWNRRWNQIMSNCLRSCVYNPIMEGRLVHRPGEPGPAFSRARRMVAVLASFLVSGLVHEGLYWYYTGRFTPHLLWLWHFVLWGLIIVGENVGRRALRDAGIVVPLWAATALTLTLLHAMVGLFWFPPLNQAGIMQLGTANLYSGWQGAKAAALRAWGA